MLVKLVGAICIIVACAGIGFQITITHRKTEKSMRSLISGIESIQRELQYRMSPLPDILHQIGSRSEGIIGRFFILLAEELERQVSPNISYCVEAAIGRLRDTPETIKRGMILLGQSLGQFDINGQIKALESVKKECYDILNTLTSNQDVRLRNYQTIALCAGIAVAILFI